MTLTAGQREFLLAAKAWWQEGDRSLDFLAERERQRAVFASVIPHLNALRETKTPTGAQVAPLLTLGRKLATNSALNRTRETDAFASALRDLLFGNTPLPERLTAFLTESGVGPQTAAQMLYVAFPDRFPLVNDVTRGLLNPSLTQRTVARRQALVTFGISAEDVTKPVRDLLADFALYEAARSALNVADFADLNAILWRAREMPKGKTKREKRTGGAVREAKANYQPDTPPATEAELLTALEARMASEGFVYPPLAVRNYYLALKTKPFVILTGLSGTGKTRLTELLAEGLTGNTASYRLFPVRPDWTDATPLLGYYNVLRDVYVTTPFLDLIREAGRPENRERAYFVCLDEMNLARVEHYLADILSAMETRDRAIPLPGGPTVTLPANLFLTGTVNIDEATYPFSRKVLDRANVIEFASADLSRPVVPERVVVPEIPPKERQRLFLRGRVENFAEAEVRLDPALTEGFLDDLNDLNSLLSDRSQQFGFRVRDEALRYLAHAFDMDGNPLLIPGDRDATRQIALDLQVLQKVLPRLSGTEESLAGLLGKLEIWAETQGLTRTQGKVARMRRRAAEDGVVTFYEP